MTERPSSTQQYLRSIAANVVDVDRDEQLVRIEGALPPVGTPVEIAIDSERRHRLMRTHTASRPTRPSRRRRGRVRRQLVR